MVHQHGRTIESKVKQESKQKNDKEYCKRHGAESPETWAMRKAGIWRLSKCGHGGEWRDSVRQNLKQIMEMMERIGEEIALINAHSKKRKRKWIGHTLKGDSLLRMAIERKWRESRQDQDESRWCCTGCWQVYMESLKKRPISEKSGDFCHLILSRKHRKEEEPTKWKPWFTQSWWWGKKNRTSLPNTWLSVKSLTDIEVK